MPVDETLALKLAGRLATIPDCPRSEDAIDALCDDLQKYCRDDEEATWVVGEARVTWKKWQGTSGLLDLLDARRNPISSRPECKPFDMGPKPPVACAMCSDWGYVGNAPGQYRYCDCAAGNAERTGNPHLLAKYNSGVTKTVAQLQEAPPRKPITQEDILHAIQERKRQQPD